MFVFLVSRSLNTGEKWSKLAKTGSVDFLENRADPKHNI